MPIGAKCLCSQIITNHNCRKELTRYFIIIDNACRKVEGALGAVDPREFKTFLEGHGINCWLDVERAGKVCYNGV